MNAPAKIETPLAKLREPFPPHQISKLPKPLKRDAAKGRCNECGGYHGLPAIHLDYVGHAALTDRLLDTDPEWSWEPLALDEHGLPAIDRNGGLWIKLTVLGVTRLGYGHAGDKRGGDAIKEIIGDALRNAAMRFGAALELWHKGDLHLESEADDDGADQGHSEKGAVSPDGPTSTLRDQLEQSLEQDASTPKPVKGWREPDSIYSTPTKLHAALIAHHAELERLGIEGTFDDLDEYLAAPEYQEYIRVANKHSPHYLDGPRPEFVPAEFVQTFALETKARDMIAIRGNIPADVEG